MSDLTVYLESDARRPELRTSDAALIAAHLAHAGILYERWNAETPFPPDSDTDTDTVLHAYAVPIERLKQARRFVSADIVRITPRMDGLAALRAKFLDEHTHDEDEARFFIEGTGAFYIHLKARVFRVVCEAGDLLSIPAGTPHWFDMGPKPRFTTIRFFGRPDGWVATLTGDTIASRFPSFDPDAVQAA